MFVHVLYVNATCPCCMYVLSACPWHMSLLFVPAACPFRMDLLHVHTVDPCLRVGTQLLKMLRHKSKTQFVNLERNTQNAIALLNYLKRIVPQQLMLRMQVFTKKVLKQAQDSHLDLQITMH
jgi:hypothetical protein